MPRQYTKAQQDSIDEQIADWLVNQMRPASHAPKVPSMTAPEQDAYAREVVDRLGLTKEFENLTGGSPEQQLQDNVKKRMTENPKLTYSMALREVSRERPDLYFAR